METRAISDMTIREANVAARDERLSPPMAGARAVEANRNSVSVDVDPAIVQLLGKRIVVIGLLAVVGPIGLPALWLSKRFSRTTKIVMTVLFLLATIVGPLALTYYWTEIALRPLVEAFDRP